MSLSSRLRQWKRGAKDLPEELAVHMEALRQERLELGDTPEEAARYARLKIGNLTAVQESVHEASAQGHAETMFRHFRLAFRNFARHRRAYGSAIVILVLGIGMSTAMYSLVDTVLLRPLPYPNQDAIQVIWKADPVAGKHIGELAYPELADLQTNVPEYQFVALMPTTVYGYGKVLQIGEAEPFQVESAPVSHDFFRVLGIDPVLGRGFEARDESEGAAPVIVLSDSLWRQHFSANPAVVGTQIRVNGEGHTIIGVLAPGAAFPRDVDLWAPLGRNPRMMTNRAAVYLQAIARLRPGANPELARNQVEMLFHLQISDHPGIYSQTQRAVVTPLPAYWTGSAGLHLWVMLAASVLLLLAAAVTAGNLFLSRTLARQQEIATRAALGASRPQLLLQFMLEGIAAGTLAAVGGLAVAYAAIRALVYVAPADIPRLAQAALHPEAFALATAVALAAAVLCSVLPGMVVIRASLERSLREGGNRSGSSRMGARAQNLFVFAQATVTVALLVLSVLLVSTYRSMMQTDLGFANEGTVTMNLALRGLGPSVDEKQRDDFYATLLQRLREAPGVQAAGAVLVRPLQGPIGWDVAYEFEHESGTREASDLPKSQYQVVTSGYFETIGTVITGRDFSAHDRDDTEPVAIISKALAQRLEAAGHAPIGHRIRLENGQAVWRKIVGIAADARYRGITQDGLDVYVPHRQAAQQTNYLVIHGNLPEEALVQMVRREVAKADPRQAIADPATLAQLVDRDAARHRFNMVLLLWFGACALILSAAGVSSAIAESVAVRSKEISIKATLGASRPRLVSELIRDSLLFVLAGEVLGLCGAVALARLGQDLLYGVKPYDPIVLGVVFVFLLMISATAALIPAWGAASRDPKLALSAS